MTTVEEECWTFEDMDPARQPDPFALARWSYEQTHYMEAFDVEKWYPLLSAAGSTTFWTEYFPITLQEADAMILHYRHYTLEWRVGDSNDHCWKEDEHALILKKLQSRMQSAMDDRMKCPAYFVRLSCRSPKDVSLDPENTSVLRLLLAELDGGDSTVDKNNDNDPIGAMPRSALVQNLADAFDAVSPHTALSALFRASGKALRITDAESAMKLLLASERVYSDLIDVMERCVKAKDHPYKWKMTVAVREWNDQVELANEFRCFVVDSKITAISQYCEYMYLAQWANREEEIKTLVLKAWENIKGLLNRHYKACVLDFVIFPDAAEGSCKVQVIEVNPFGPMTGSCCFDWKKDRKLLLGGVQSWDQVGTLPASRSEEGTVVRLAPVELCSQARAPLPFFELIRQEAIEMSPSDRCKRHPTLYIPAWLAVWSVILGIITVLGAVSLAAK